MANPSQAGGESATTAPHAAAPTAAPAAGINFKQVLQEMIQRNGSDLHLKVGRPPTCGSTAS